MDIGTMVLYHSPITKISHSSLFGDYKTFNLVDPLDYKVIYYVNTWDYDS
jgi:hypothetical protein